MGRRPAPRVTRPNNPLRKENQRQIRAPTPIIQPQKKAKRVCPNKECSEPRIEDGVCTSCGSIIDESNIVAEVQFGESSQGAAVVQGSYLAADQGHSRMQGPAAMRHGGNEGGKKITENMRDARTYMMNLQRQFNLTQEHVDSGMRLYNLAMAANFVQGRTVKSVAAACLYTHCRTKKPCKVMLIDFADKVDMNVFKLGHTFKGLHKAVPLASAGINPVLPEDLIYRFAEKLEFGPAFNKVSEVAIRLAQRMSLDWMVMGRRPAGVCGACLILAARMHNFRRTIQEVVFIVKVTTATIQKRLDEFKQTPTSNLTIDDFLNNQLEEQQHDPPSFYEKQDYFVANKKTKKRKRKGIVEEGEQDDPPDKRQKTAEPQALLRRDADGFAIPAQPSQPARPARPRTREDLEAQRQQHDIVDDAIANMENVGRIIETFGNLLPEEFGPDEPLTNSTLKKIGRSTSKAVQIPVDFLAEEDAAEAEYASFFEPSADGPDNSPRGEEDEEDDEDDDGEGSGARKLPLSEEISDPSTDIHRLSFKRACRKARAYMKHLAASGTWKDVCMDSDITEEEFEDDPDVKNCLLGTNERALKEKMWFNSHKGWLEKQQEKEQKARLLAANPKKRRNRVKKPKIGEDVEEGATPQEAAANMMKKLSYSKKLNYDNMTSDVFGDLSKLGSKYQGSPGTSRATSAAPSTINLSDDESDSEAESEALTGVRNGSVAREASVAASVAGSVQAGGDEPMQDDEEEEEEGDNADFMRQLLREREDGEAQDEGDYGGGYEDEGFASDGDGGNISEVEYD